MSIAQQKNITAPYGNFLQTFLIPDKCEFTVTGTTDGNPTVIQTENPHCLADQDSVVLCLHCTDGCQVLDYSAAFTATVISETSFSIPWDSTNCGSLAGKGHKPKDLTNYSFTGEVFGYGGTAKNYQSGTNAVGLTDRFVLQIDADPGQVHLYNGGIVTIGGESHEILGVNPLDISVENPNCVSRTPKYPEGLRPYQLTLKTALTRDINNLFWIIEYDVPTSERVKIADITVSKDNTVGSISWAYDYTLTDRDQAYEYRIYQQVGTAPIEIRYLGGIVYAEQGDTDCAIVDACAINVPVVLIPPTLDDVANVPLQIGTAVELQALNDATLSVGAIRETLGFYAVDDGGGCKYRLQNAGPTHALPATSGRVWVPIVGEIVNPRCLGAQDGQDDIALFNTIATNFKGVILDQCDYGPFSAQWNITDDFSIRGIGWQSKMTWEAQVNGISLFNDDNVLIEKVHIIGARSVGVTNINNLESGVRIQRSANVTVRDCFIENWGGAGIYLLGGENLRIHGNTLFRQGDGDDIRSYGSEGTPNYRLDISGNFCFSNTSLGQGIAVSLLGGDTNVSIRGNHCVTLDDATCIEDGTWSLAVESSVVRRHGILVGYASATAVTQAIIANGNTCQNTNWTGFYVNGDHGNQNQVVSNNVCITNGIANGTGGDTLMGGIFSGKQSIVVTGNLIDDFRGRNAPGNFESAGIHYRGIHTDLLDADLRVAGVCSGNKVSNSTIGIAIHDRGAELQITGNAVSNSTYYDVQFALSSGGYGNVVFSSNMFIRANNDYFSVTIEAANASKPIFLEGNKFLGTLNRNDQAATTTPCIDYRGQTVENLHLSNNYFYQWHTAIDFRVNATERHTATICNNYFREMLVAIAASRGAGTGGIIPLVDNKFDNVTSKIGVSSIGSAGTEAGVVCTMLEDNIHSVGSSPPTVGDYIRGDLVWNDAPAVGQTSFWQCTLAGNPGTWGKSPVLEAV
jgi:hypothetical protein